MKVPCGDDFSNSLNKGLNKVGMVTLHGQLVHHIIKVKGLAPPTVLIFAVA